MACTGCIIVVKRASCIVIISSAPRSASACPSTVPFRLDPHLSPPGSSGPLLLLLASDHDAVLLLVLGRRSLGAGDSGRGCLVVDLVLEHVLGDLLGGGERPDERERPGVGVGGRRAGSGGRGEEGRLRGGVELRTRRSRGTSGLRPTRQEDDANWNSRGIPLPPW